MKNIVATILLGLTLASCGPSAGNLKETASGFEVSTLHERGNAPNINLEMPGVIEGSIETNEHGKELTFVFKYFNNMHMDTFPLSKWNQLADEGSCETVQDIKPIEFSNLTDTAIEIECVDGSTSYMYLDNLVKYTNSQKHWSVEEDSKWKYRTNRKTRWC